MGRRLFGRPVQARSRIHYRMPARRGLEVAGYEVSARTNSLRFVGEAEYIDSGTRLLATPGDAALVRRGRLRSILIACPDGCGETLVINLDSRAGKAWKLYRRGKILSLYPSVWRDGGCGSHFIVWRSKIIWCGRYGDDHFAPSYDVALEKRVLELLERERSQTAEELSLLLGEIPWEVGQAARSLVRKGRAIRKHQAQREFFRLK